MQTDSDRPRNAISGYESRLASEIDIYRNCTNVHNLPPIFHYWSNRFLRPKLEPHGFKDPAGMFLFALERHFSENFSASKLRFLSIGSGNCDLEVGIATALRSRGHSNFIIECVDLNCDMLERGAVEARKRGLAANMEFAESDLNRWVAQREYHAIMADQSLHHVVELEFFFGQVQKSLAPDGIFIVSDMIGRNGHLRWPEALAIIRELWRNLPPSYRRNCRSGRYEAVFEDADCSTESFEGIRAQDILRLLADTFHFRFFLGFGNLIDPFVDRSFGPNFDAEADWDRWFIDQVHRRDEEELAAGRLQPTHMLAVLGNQPEAGPIFGAFTPPRIVQVFATEAGAEREQMKSGYEWGSWPHSAENQLACVCRAAEDAESRIKSLEQELDRARTRVQQLEIEFQERTAWALQLDRQLNAARAIAIENEEELIQRAVWARRLQAELTEKTAWALQLDAEFSERTDWALSLDREVAELRLQLSRRRHGLSEYLRYPVRLAGRLFAGNGDKASKPSGSPETAHELAPPRG